MVHCAHGALRPRCTAPTARFALLLLTVTMPLYLRRYKLRALFTAVDMRWDWPVDANFHEAKAFCVWRTELDGSSVKWVG